MTALRRPIHLLGVPFNSAGREDGVARAPAALRAAGLVEAIRDAGCDVVDQGDIALGPTSPVRDPDSGLIAPGALAAMIRTVRRSIQASVAAGAFPVVIGGDCPVLIGCLGAFAADGGSAGILFVDGHEDAWPPRESPTGEAADSELGLLLDITTAGIPGDLRAELPTIDRHRVSVVGPRDLGELEEAGVRSIFDLVDGLRDVELRNGSPGRLVRKRVDRLDSLGPWWLHVDLDVLSSAALPAVDYPQPGGLGWKLLLAMTRAGLRGRRVCGWSVTIYNPDLDPAGSAARRIVRYAGACAGVVSAP